MRDFHEQVNAALDFQRRNKNRSTRMIEAYRLAPDHLAEYFAGRDPLERTRDDLALFTGIGGIAKA